MYAWECKPLQIASGSIYPSPALGRATEPIALALSRLAVERAAIIR